MARRLLGAGYPLTVFNRSREKAVALSQEGVKLAECPRDAASGAEFLVSMVADDNASRSMWLTATIVAALALFAVWTYRQLAAVTGRDRIVLITTRTALFLVALFALLRPTLLLKVAVPQQNFVAILLDDSSSMRVADENGGPRRAFVEDQLGRPDGPLLTALGKRFVPRVFRFSTSAERLQSTADLTFAGTGTPYGSTCFDNARVTSP